MQRNIYLFWSAIMFVFALTDMIGSKFLPVRNSYITGSCLVFLLFLIITKTFLTNKKQVFPLIALFSFVVLMLFQTITPSSKAYFYDQIRILGYLVIMFLFSLKGYGDEINTISLIIKTIVIIGSISILSFTGLDNTVYGLYRHDALIDKGLLTIWYALLFCTSTIEIINKKHVTFNAILLIAIFCFNLFIVQSKTAILSYVAFLLCMFLLSSSGRRKRIITRLVSILFVLGILIYMFPEELLPNSVKLGINYLFNTETFNTTREGLGTFNLRAKIDAFTLALFLKNPIIGIGIGAYKDIGFFGITECENSYMDMLVEGGILFGGPVILLMLYVLFKSIKNIRKGIAVSTNYMVLAIIVSMLISFRYNDFIRPSIFMSLGCCYFLVNKSKQITEDNT